MRRILLYIIVLASMWYFKPAKTDIGMLRAVELIYVYRENGEIVIETDTEDVGIGGTMKDAIANLKETTAGTIYLDTADYALFHRNALDEVRSLATYIKPKVGICATNGEISVKEAAKYLAAHNPQNQIGKWDGSTPLEWLHTTGEKIIKNYEESS